MSWSQEGGERWEGVMDVMGPLRMQGGEQSATLKKEART
jgi:hypothetical protein